VAPLGVVDAGEEVVTWYYQQECICLNYSKSEELVRRGIAILADEINAIYRGS
jgi:valine--pyruvate aminotransferase